MQPEISTHGVYWDGVRQRAGEDGWWRRFLFTGWAPTTPSCLQVLFYNVGLGSSRFIWLYKYNPLPTAFDAAQACTIKGGAAGLHAGAALTQASDLFSAQWHLEERKTRFSDLKMIGLTHRSPLQPHCRWDRCFRCVWGGRGWCRCQTGELQMEMNAKRRGAAHAQGRQARGGGHTHSLCWLMSMRKEMRLV